MLYHVYILRSRKDKNLYVGHTQNLEKRIRAHNSRRVRSTRHRAPLDLMYSEEFHTRGEAIKRERYLKSLEGSEQKRMLTGGSVRKEQADQSHPYGLVAGSNPVSRL
jgi:putative endonuclease